VRCHIEESHLAHIEGKHLAIKNYILFHPIQLFASPILHPPLCVPSGRHKPVVDRSPRSSIMVCRWLGWASTLDEVEEPRLLASDGVRIRVIVGYDVVQDSVKFVLCRVLALELVHM
jgi:hypothetical protein